MPVANPWKSYRRIATQTAPPGQLVLMLFDGALLALDRALLGFNLTEIGERNTAIHNNLQRALDIIQELDWALDMQAGGQLAETLRNLYSFFERRITESNRKKSRQGIDEIVPMVRSLRDAWYQMLNGASAEATSARWLPNQFISA
ncbi:MAG: flagellar export chaperone FliS [Verrucomicrobiae bacterium]|nr:flagellar export chaperone FliS [Verrucomicrobiae bacterium]